LQLCKNWDCFAILKSLDYLKRSKRNRLPGKLELGLKCNYNKKLDQFAIKAKIWAKSQKVKNKTGKKSNLKTT